MPTKWLHRATHYTVLSLSWLPSMMGSLTPTSGLAANSHLWACSFGHLSSNWSRLHFPSNPFGNGDFHSRCSLHNALGRKKAGWGRRTWTAVRLQQRSQPACGGLLELDELFRISLGWCQQPGPMDTCGETITGCSCLDRDSGVSAQQRLPLHGGKWVSPSAAWRLTLRLQCC